MIIPILAGGLGNQMFQIANAYAYSLRHNCKWGINYNLSFCPNQGHTANKYRDNFFKNIPVTDKQFELRYKEIAFHYVPISYCSDDFMVDGYFQSEKYFIDFKDEVKNLFVFPDDIKNKVDTFLNKLKSPILGIHIRRGDYKKFSHVHPLKGPEYYIQALKNISNKKDCIICTDDWDSVNSEMNFPKAIKSPFTEELEDMYLLSQCDSLILCNSSFSWWSAYLNKTKDKIVAPKIWFDGTGPKDYYDIFREDWILI